MITFCFVESAFSQNAMIFIASLACSVLEIGVNISVLISNTGEDQSFWLQLNYGMFGIGGLFGPILVNMFGTSSFAVMGIVIAIAGTPFCFLESPESKLTEEQK